MSRRWTPPFADAWDRAHQQLQRRAGWAQHHGELPVVEGTLVRLVVDRLPGDRHPKPVWLWASATSLDAAQVDRLWQAYLRRFDIEHMFRLFKQTLGWARPRIRDPQAADRWTWLIITVHTQLCLARDLTTDLRRPWERTSTTPGRLTPPEPGADFATSARRCPAGRCAETHPARPRMPTRLQNRQVAAHPPVGKTQHQTATQQSRKRQKV